MMVVRENDEIKIAIVVTCHEGYKKYLRKCIKYVNEQVHTKFFQKILVLDSVEEPVYPNEWEVVRVNHGHSNKARNAGFEQIKDCKWVVFWDADNVMAEDYLLKLLEDVQSLEDKRVGFIYPSISYRTPINLNCHYNDSKQIRLLQVPDWDYWGMRERTYIDTSSIWRFSALLSIGGWSEDQKRLDDWELALRLSENGWIGKKSKNAQSYITEHNARKTLSPSNKIEDAAWTARSVGVVTLFGPKLPCLKELIDWYKKSDFPPKTSIYWLNNSGNKEFEKELIKHINSMRDKFRSVTFISYSSPFVTENHKDINRHSHVANLYNKIIPRITEDLILMVEDDNIPRYNDLRMLSDTLSVNSKIAAMGGSYRSRNSPQTCCASRNMDQWRDCYRFDDLPDVPVRVGMMGGGFTLYKNSAIKKAIPFRCEKHEKTGGLMGWDGTLGRSLTKLGYYLMLHGGVKIQHMCKEVLEWEKFNIGREITKEEIAV